MERRKKLREGWLVEITWDDAHDCGDVGRTWQERGEFTSAEVDFRGRSVGYVLKEADGFVYIAGDMMGDFASRVFAVPRGCIKNVRFIA